MKRKTNLTTKKCNGQKNIEKKAESMDDSLCEFDIFMNELEKEIESDLDPKNFKTPAEIDKEMAKLKFNKDYGSDIKILLQRAGLLDD